MKRKCFTQNASLYEQDYCEGFIPPIKNKSVKGKHTIAKPFIFFGIVTLIISVVLASCSTKKLVKTPLIDAKPQDKEVFILKPLGYEPTIKNFKTNLPSSFKLQVYSMKNIHNPAITDTIYRFHQKNSEFFIYKNITNRELFFAGNIYTPKIQLKNGVKVGMSKVDFFRCFSNLKSNPKDTIRISSKKAANSVNFIFKDDKLNIIKIDNYID